MDNRQYVYLVGQISPGNIKTYEWRINITKYVKELCKGVTIINPCISNFDALFYKNGMRELENNKHSSNILTPKGLGCVLKSTIGIVNINLYDAERPFVGSIFELAWYYERPDKPVIGIYNEQEVKSDVGKLFKTHPFIQDSVHVWVKDEKEAAELLNKYFCYDKEAIL